MDIAAGLDDVRENSRAVILTTRLVSGANGDDYRQAMTDDQRCIVRFEITSAGPDVAG